MGGVKEAEALLRAGDGEQFIIGQAVSRGVQLKTMAAKVHSLPISPSMLRPHLSSP